MLKNNRKIGTAYVNALKNFKAFTTCVKSTND